MIAVASGALITIGNSQGNSVLGLNVNVNVNRELLTWLK